MKIEAKYNGGSVVVHCDGVLLRPGPSQRIRNHSPTGFNWGYEGSGPAQLALAILMRAIGPQRAARAALYQTFKREIVARQPGGEDWTLDLDVVAWAREAEAARDARDAAEIAEGDK